MSLEKIIRLEDVKRQNREARAKRHCISLSRIEKAWLVICEANGVPSEKSKRSDSQIEKMIPLVKAWLHQDSEYLRASEELLKELDRQDALEKLNPCATLGNDKHSWWRGQHEQ